MPQPSTNPAPSDPDRFERDRSTPQREPSSVADDRPPRPNRIADDDPLIDEAEVMPENDFEDEKLGRSDR